ncbi:hypothetical protein CLAFUW4_08755 [Fulvia fulva]|uniref:Uncharacterized protein n=1 Tax=Passalora fulva TaxID=5499 RepID=A0A9Q8PFN1_PASFU|nr:uncharacterized protein CLAFUR5_08855 [Fulvia fulva]KAK4613696.1 hypothetical protein CLAFUR4_08760 [Fulvia fulva]KAK4615172.1 hypothetical protein CLAFUR0_08755 [Fulvia fulva]UJO21542.1 hypothetical protein CLAFUR5_08855 [Fulvia fulva]WPV19776.1 hypothetical protein CLAFUW4_08755 [Fulvia fulva]WPV35530.1 hypothetical protein CLAFUW7_08755 [Fulvia fulva]
MGWSMSAGQAFQWATQYSDFMDRVIPDCGSTKTSLHNSVFLEVSRVLYLARKELPRLPFYREKVYMTAPALGFKDLEDFMVNFWEAWAWDKAGDVSAQEPYNGNFDAAMKGIKAKTLVLPCKTDLYLPPEDSEIEVQDMRPGVGELAVFPINMGSLGWRPGTVDRRCEVASREAEIYVRP